MEELTENLSAAIRLQLGLGGRVPDTTMRDVLCRIDPDELRACLHGAVKAARRRKALRSEYLPFQVVALDGKATALPCWDEAYAQRHVPEHGLPYGLVRTVTAAQVSAGAAVHRRHPCAGQHQRDGGLRRRIRATLRDLWRPLRGRHLRRRGLF